MVIGAGALIFTSPVTADMHSVSAASIPANSSDRNRGYDQPLHPIHILPGTLMPVTSIESLRDHLQWAIELEHSTLPPYLCALYSIKPGSNPAATAVLTSVFIEEM